MGVDQIVFAPSLSQESYAACFGTFREFSSEWESILTWARDKLLKKLPDKEELSILSVGSGTGGFDFQLIQILNSKIKTFEYVALEPNEELCRQFRAGIEENLFHNVRFEIHSVPFEEFETEKRFDLVHLTHSLYYLPDRKQAILNAISLTHDDGCVLIINQTTKGIYQTQRKFMKKVKGSEKEMFSSRELQGILDHHRIPYDLDVVDSFVDISHCLRANSESGQQLLSFILECDMSRLAPEIKQELVEYIQEISFYDQGRPLLFHPIAIFSLAGSLPLEKMS